MSSHNRSLVRTALMAFVLAACASRTFAQITLPPCSGTLQRFSVCEIVLSASTSYANGYKNASVAATFTLTGGSITKAVNGFWDGGAVFKIRFNASNAGTWTYSTTSSDPSLSGRSGSFSVSSSGGRGFVRRNTSLNPEKFVFDTGTRYFMWGQTYYQIVDNAKSGNNWQVAVDNSFGHSMNKVRMLVSPFPDAPYNGINSQPFVLISQNPLTYDHDKLDLTHWQKLDTVVNYLNQKPMVADLILFNDHPEVYGNTVAQDQRFVRYVIARLGAFPNVIWCLTNEWDNVKLGAPHASDLNYWNTLGGIIRSEDPWMDQGGNQRALSIHQRTEKDFLFFNQPSSAPWAVHAVLQYGPRNIDGKTNPDVWGNFSITNNMTSGHNLPVVNDEYGYIGEYGSTMPRTGHRQAIWGIATAAGYGSTGDLATSTTADWLDEPEYGDVSNMVDFFVNHVSTWWQMTSQNSLIAPGSRVYVLGQTGVRYVVYAALGGSVTLNLPAPSGASTYRVFLYDPATGGPEQTLANVGAGSQTIRIPNPAHSDGGNDWVLRIEI